MSEWLEIVSYSICSALMVMMVLGIVFSACMPALERWNKRYFITLFSLILLYVVVIFIDLLIWNTPNMVTVGKIIVVFEYLLFSSLTLMPMFFLLHCYGENIKHSLLFRTVMTLWGIFCLMLSVAQFTDIFYYVTPNNQYFRSSWFPLLIAPFAVIMTINIYGLNKRRKKLSKKVFIALLVYMLPMTTAIIVYMFVSVDILASLVITLCVLATLSLILTDNMEQYMRQQREISQQRASVMVLQMRPHFICNSMMSIYYLCDQDPEKAKQVTLDFTTYLRKNFAAIASENTIPFKDELEHTRAYLAVEQAQFEDSLFVHFDTPHILFRVPPLTLQPIVENAVKHGMKSCDDPIHISVITRQTDTASEIIVEDDGPGFNPIDGNKPHIALNNIRQRLELMCKGKLEIIMCEKGGTLVKVTIPVSNS